MFAKVKRVEARGFKRLIFISDVHGNGHLLERLLKELAFSSQDGLFLLGDYIEKGQNSLRAARLAMALCENGNAFALQGNCDTLWQDLENNLYRVDLNGYVDWRKQSILADMCAELGLDRVALGSEATARALEAAYGDVFAWLGELPQIIETEDFLCAHAGLDDLPLELQDAERCLCRDAFLEENPRFDRFVTVGHMPLANYFFLTGNKLSYQPIIDLERNVISIDGGNGVKAVGQLNAVVYENGAFSWRSADDLPKARVIGAQEESARYASVAWNHKEVELIRKGENASLCRHIFTGETLEIPNALLFEHRGALCSYDYTTYRPALVPGEEVAVLERHGSDAMIKKNGVLGWAKTSALAE